MPSSATEPAKAAQSGGQAEKSCPPGCCSGVASQDAKFLTTLADTLAAQSSHKRGSLSETSGRNVSQRSVRFSLDLESTNVPPCEAVRTAAVEMSNSSPHQAAAAAAAAASSERQQRVSSPSKAVQDSVPLGPVSMDYSFTERGALPEGLEASGLAAAFGPEPHADEMPQPHGVSARIQVGDALVTLLEHHHKDRYALATADPDEVAASKGFIGGPGGDEPVELDHRARSLTRSLARSASSSPLVQLLALHRKRRENLTGWQDEAAVPGGDSAPLPFPQPRLCTIPAKLQLQPEVTKAQLGEEISALVAQSSGAASLSGTHISGPPSLRSGPPSLCSGPPSIPSGPPSLRSGPSSVHSMRSSGGGGSSAGSARFSFSGTPSVTGSGSESVYEIVAADPQEPALDCGQCPGCGSMTACYCKDVDLASHPSQGSLETGPDLDAPPVAKSRQSSSACSLREQLPDAPDAQSSAIRKMLAAQLTDSAPLTSTKAASVGGGATPQKLIEASRHASFNEVLSRCLSIGSGSASPGSKRAAAVDEQIVAPFIPIDSGSLGKLDLRQSLKPGRTSRWSFDSALLPQYVHGRPGIVERRSVDGGSVSTAPAGEARPSYTSLMAAYRERLGMSSTSSSLATAKISDAPTASDAISEALKQALRSQLTSPAGSRRASEDTPSAARAYGEMAFPPQPPLAPSQRSSCEQPPPQPGHSPQLAQLALASQLFGSSPQQGTPPAAMPPPQLRRCSSERRRSGSYLPTVDESPPAPAAPESPVALAPHDAAAAAKARLFRALEESRGARLARHSFGGAPLSGRPPMSPRRMSVSEGVLPASAGAAVSPLEALGLAAAPEDATPRRLSCARARSNMQQQKAQQGPGSAKTVATAATSRLPLCSPKATTEAGNARQESQKRQAEAHSHTAGVLAAVAQQLEETTRNPTEVPVPDLAPLCHTLRPLRVPSPSAAAADKRVAANMRELSLAHLVKDTSQDESSGSEEDAKVGKDGRAADGSGSTEPGAAAGQLAATCAPASGAAAAAADGRPGAASRGAAARALFAVDRSADAASRAMVRSLGAGRPQEVWGGASGGAQPPPSSLPQGTKATLGFQSLQPLGEHDVPRRSATFSPSTPPVQSEPAPFSPDRMLSSLPPTSAEEFGGRSTFLAVYSEASFSGHPALSTAVPLSVPVVDLPGKLHAQPLFSSPVRSDSHELLDTYGAHRVRAEAVRAEALRCGSGSHTRLGLGLMPPSAMWVEHRAGALVAPVLHHRGHYSMDAIRMRPLDAFSPPTGLLPFPHPVFEGTPESVERQRRDSYLARTLSNMARAKLDHAMALAAQKEGPPEKWEMRFADDGPEATFGRSSGSEEGVISRAKRMMAEAAAAHPSHAYFTDGNIARRDADGITALLDVLATPKTPADMQERALSTLAFLATSAANAKILAGGNGVAVLVPLLGARSDGVVTAAAGILRRLLPLPNSQAVFLEENGLAILTSLLSASKSTPVLLAALRTLICLAGTPEASPEDAAAGAALIARCGAVSAAVRLACPAACGGVASAGSAKSGVGCVASSGAAANGASSGTGDGTIDHVPLAALALLLKLASRPELRPALRSANVMSALASMMVPGAPEAVLSPAIQLTAMLASDMAAAAEFAARGGVIGLMALVSDGGDKEGVIAVQAAAVLGCLVQCSRARSAVWAAGGGSMLLPALLEASPLALSGVLYLMSCLAEFKDLRAELEAADAVPMLLDLLATCTDTQIQAATVSLLRIFTRSGETLCPILEHQATTFSSSEPRFEAQRQAHIERRSFDSCQKKQADRKPDMAPPGRTQSLSLF